MTNTNNLNLIMISAGFEHGGNVTLRLLDGHPELFVYPFESQLGNCHTVDYLSSLERFQYRYPEFPAGLTPRELYELFYDEELKTLLRKPNTTKFKMANIIMSEDERIQFFCDTLEGKNFTRANIVAAFFKSTFKAWKNYKLSGNNYIYVGYSPIIGIDAHKILFDFPNSHIIHVIRNPLSAYSDTKQRPFPLSFRQYITSWNLYHHILLMQQRCHPNRITILRYEDIIGDTKITMQNISKKIGISYSNIMCIPSFNGKDISDNIYPWGTINKATPQENILAANRLSLDEAKEIIRYSKEMIQCFSYTNFVNSILEEMKLVENVY